MKHRTSTRLVPIVIISVVCIVTGASEAAGATGLAQPAVSPARAAAPIVLTLGASVVKPGQRTALVATVRPRVAGRVVFLREKRSHRFVNIASSVTNRRGEAVFRHTFLTRGSFVLRATAVATATLSAATSKTAVESVAEVLPFVLSPNQVLQENNTGAAVLGIQQRLSALGYWLGTPNGNFGDATLQAVYAFEKAAGLNRSGIVGPQFVAALNAGVVPKPRTTSGDAIEVDLERDIVMFVQNGSLKYVLNTSTGGGYTYTEDGVTSQAITPRGVFAINRVVDGLVVDSLGALWRPRFFDAGFAIHGDSFVPPVPESHGCVRISNEAINWVWAQNLAPVGMKFWLY